MTSNRHIYSYYLPLISSGLGEIVAYLSIVMLEVLQYGFQSCSEGTAAFQYSDNSMYRKDSGVKQVNFRAYLAIPICFVFICEALHGSTSLPEQ